MSKGKKKPVTTPSSSPSAASSASVQPPSPSLSSTADDTKIKQYVQSVLATMLSQPGSQVNLGSNPFISAPVEVPDIPSQGSTVGRGSESLIRCRFVSPSGVVPPPTEDVMPPIHVSVLCSVDSLGFDRFSGSLFPPLGDSTPLSSRTDQLRDCGDLGLTQDVIFADVHHVPRSVSAFEPSSLLFPFSDSGFSSLPPPTPSSIPSFSSLSSTAPSSTVPLFSLPSVVPSVLPPPSVALASFPSPSSFSMFPLLCLPLPVLRLLFALRLLLLSPLCSRLLPFLCLLLFLLILPLFLGSRLFLRLLPLLGLLLVSLQSPLPLLRVILRPFRLRFQGFRKNIRLWGVGLCVWGFEFSILSLLPFPSSLLRFPS